MTVRLGVLRCKMRAGDTNGLPEPVTIWIFNRREQRAQRDLIWGRGNANQVIGEEGRVLTKDWVLRLSNLNPQLILKSLNRFIWMGRRRRDRHGFEPDAFLEVGDRGLELRVFPIEGRMGQVVHHNIRIDAVSFNEPFAFGAVNAMLGG